MSNHEWKVGDKVLVEGEVLSPASSELPAEIGMYCEYIQTRGSLFPSEDAIHPFPVAPYPAEVTEEMVKAVNEISQLSRGRCTAEEIVEAVLNAAPAQEPDSWQPIETYRDDGFHFRGVWVHNAKPDSWRWEVHFGYLTDEGDFVGTEDEDFGLSADDYTHWLPFNAPPPPDNTPLSPKQEPEPAINLDEWEDPFFGIRKDGQTVALYKNGIGTWSARGVISNKSSCTYLSDGTPKYGNVIDFPPIVSIHPSATPRTREVG